MTEPAQPEETKMESGAAKPRHGWRGYLKEYAIIVVGVLTALGAQQVADWLHWQSEVKTARQAIQAEMRLNNVLYARRLDFAPCLERQAVEAGRILDDLEARRPPGRFTNFQPGAGTSLRDSEWQSERAAQTLTHFPRAELALMGAHYSQLPNVAIWVMDEGTNWRALSVLRHPPKEMPVSDLLRLRTALEMVKNSEWLILSAARRQLRLSRQLGIADPDADPERTKKFCTLNIEEFVPYLLSLETRP